MTGIHGRTYSDPYLTTFQQTFDFGGGAAATRIIRGPKGRRGRVRRVGLAVIEAFAVNTQTGFVRVGTAADPDAYAELIVPDGTAVSTWFDSEHNDTDAIKDLEIPADSDVHIDYVNGTDGTAVTGQGDTVVEIEWF